jgi:hypothetical protein
LFNQPVIGSRTGDVRKVQHPNGDPLQNSSHLHRPLLRLLQPPVQQPCSVTLRASPQVLLTPHQQARNLQQQQQQQQL